MTLSPIPEENGRIGQASGAIGATIEAVSSWILLRSILIEDSLSLTV
jgi:hypothetical protein